MPEALLAVRDLEAFYGDFQALFGVSVEVARGEAVAEVPVDGDSAFLDIDTPQALETARRG